MSERRDLIDFVKKHYTREALDAQDMLKNGVMEVNDNAERILNGGLSRMQEEWKASVATLAEIVDRSNLSFSNSISSISDGLKSDVERTTEHNSAIIKASTEKMMQEISFLTRTLKESVIKMEDRTLSAERAAKLALIMTAISLGSFLALLLFILLGG